VLVGVFLWALIALLVRGLDQLRCWPISSMR
jgi:hypothetical protein